MHKKTYAIVLGLLSSVLVAPFVYAWTYSTPVANGDVISADKWNALVTQLVAVSVQPDRNAGTGHAQILNKPWAVSGGDQYSLNAGNVGIGSPSPAAKLDVNGGLKIGDPGSICDPGKEGVMRYNGALHRHEGCNGSTWTAFY